MMEPMQNQFLPRPREMTQAEGFAAERFAQEDAVRMGIDQMLRAQSDHEQAAQMQMGASLAGKGVGQAFPGFGASIRGAANAAMEPVRQGVRAVQSYVSGGPTTAPAGSAAAAAASQPSALSSLWGAAQPYLGAAGMGWNAYQGMAGGLAAGQNLKDAIRSGLLSPEEEAKMREDVFEQGMESGTTGMKSGALSGLAAGGPIGAAVGAVSGAAGGFTQAARANKGSGISDASAIARWQADPRNEGMGRDALIDQALHNGRSALKEIGSRVGIRI